MMNCNVAGLPHLLDRYVVSHIHRRHPFGFNHPINRHILENGPRDAATKCYWSLSALSIYFFSHRQMYYQDIPEHQRSAQHLQRLCHDCTTTAHALFPCFSDLFLHPYLWLIGPFRMTWLNLLRTPLFSFFSSLSSYFPDFLAHLLPPNDTLRYEYTAAPGNGFSLFCLLAIMHTRSFPTPQSSGLIHLHISPLFSSIPIVLHIFFFFFFFVLFTHSTHIVRRGVPPHFHDLII